MHRESRAPSGEDGGRPRWTAAAVIGGIVIAYVVSAVLLYELVVTLF